MNMAKVFSGWTTRKGRVATGILAAAMTLAASNAAFAWDPVRDVTGRTLKQHVERRVENLGNQIEKFGKDPVGYTLHLPGALLTEACAAPVRYYGTSMEGQAQGRWKALPPQIIREMQDAFANDLSAVRYAEGINTGGGSAVTMGNRIYFPRAINLYDRGDMWWLMHELEHTVQYRGESRSAKLCEYFAKSIGNGLNHDRIDWERAADRKANWTIDAAMWAIQQPAQIAQIGANQFVVRNDARMSVVFYVQSPSSDWTEFRLGPGEETTIYSDGAPASWFNIQVNTAGYENKFSVDSGVAYAINWNNRMLDFFRL
jgi:hypothetical protein